ncbi:protein LZIC-like [Anthonomus grandis grandis]|uniref:protein LZIC-like n=1 Tax=Anthonomus grandis grandis TaxID=2921223 RepID=UPI0021661FF9|nr:protein LZIC-like [Anthonomus grandis grandis]
MSSCGKNETEKLKENIKNQLDRLVEQLADLEACKGDMDFEDYNETKAETMDQLKELNLSLAKLVKGDISLITSVDATQMATQAAIAKAFKTPEVILLFGKRDSKQLRERLKDIDEQVKLNKLSAETRDRQKGEILLALRQLNEQLSRDELQFLEKSRHEFGDFKNIEFLEIKDDN